MLARQCQLFARHLHAKLNDLAGAWSVKLGKIGVEPSMFLGKFGKDQPPMEIVKLVNLGQCWDLFDLKASRGELITLALKCGERLGFGLL